MSNLILRLEFLFQSLIKRQRVCPHCHSQNLTTVARKYFIIQIKLCQNCGLYFTSPIYRSFLGNIYDSFYQGYRATELPRESELVRLKNSCFRGSKFDFHSRISFIKKIFFRNRSKIQPKLLEIGSAWGYFLYQAEAEGFKATGIEISKKRSQFGIEKLGVNIVSTATELSKESFDLIYTSNSLEHFTDISTIFKEAHSLLKTNGTLVIEVPNIDLKSFGKKTLKMIGAVHPLGFSKHFFKKNLPQYGFKDIFCYDSWEAFTKNDTGSNLSGFAVVVAKRQIDP